MAHVDEETDDREYEENRFHGIIISASTRSGGYIYFRVL